MLAAPAMRRAAPGRVGAGKARRGTSEDVMGSAHRQIPEDPDGIPLGEPRVLIRAACQNSYGVTLDKSNRTVLYCP